MAIMLGNLSAEKIGNNLSVKFDQETIEKLESMRQEDISTPLSNNKWHCFDLPFLLLCDSEETAKIIYNLLLPYQDSMKGSLSIKWQN